MCGLGRGNISNMDTNGAIGSDKLTKIFDTFPDIDLIWLLRGSSQNQISAESDKYDTRQKLLDKVIEQAEEIGQLKERIRQLEQRLGKDAASVNTAITANVG